MQRDPLLVARRRLHDLGVDEVDIEATDARAKRDVEDAVQGAKDAPDADPREALTDVWADGSSAWRT